MILSEESNVLIAHRRLFDSDSPRIFIGKVEAYESGIVRVNGHTWLRDTFSGSYVKKEDQRTKILSIASGTLIVYVLPATTQLARVRFESTPEGHLFLKDGAALKMDLTEALHGRPSNWSR